jgi:oxygen-dependent protoporphyrinogen oxidase
MSKQSEARPRVAVVGAGIAGLTAGYALQKQGFEVEVFEREQTAGGRMRSERHGDYVVERGAQFIASSYRNMRALAAELGIADLIEPLGDSRNAVLRGGEFRYADYRPKKILRSNEFSWMTKARLPLLPLELRRHRALLDDFYQPEKAASLDTESAADYARRWFGQEALDYIIDPAFASTFTVLPENMSKAFMVSTIAYMFRGFRLLAFRGGNGAMTQALASRLKVHTGVSVHGVETDDDGALVRIGSGTVQADAVVVAVPGNTVVGMCSTLTPTEGRFFSGVRYASSIIAFVMAGREALPPFYGAGIPRREGVDLYGMAIENAKPGVVPEGKTLFNCAFSESLAARVIDEPDEKVVDALKHELAKLPLSGIDTVEGYVLHRWPSMLPQFYPGYYRALSRFKRRRERSSRLFFAGDYLIAPYTEAALTSGLRAAAECAAALPVTANLEPIA